MRFSGKSLGLMLAFLLVSFLSVAFCDAAVPAAEVRAFDSAAKAFNDGFHERAEKELLQFTTRFPESELLPQVHLYHAQALFKLGKYDAALRQLEAHITTAGDMADRYRFWMGECQFQLGNLRAAADIFSALLKEAPNTTRRLEAAYREAASRFKLGETPAAIALLSGTNSVFAKAAAAQPESEPAVRGTLLLAEAHLQSRNFSAALATVQSLEKLPLNPELAWLRQYWQARAQFDSGAMDAALTSAEPLPALATKAASNEFIADSMDLIGAIHARLGHADEAIKAYEKNLDPALPSARRRAALIKITELALAKPDAEQAVQWFERFLKENPQDPALDVIRLTLGELRLREYYRLGESKLAEPARNVARSNQLAQARVQLDAFVKDFPQSPLVGKGNLNRGIALWEEDKLVEGEAALLTAVAQLPFGEDQAMAKFKLGDVQFRLGDFPKAISNYTAVVEQYGSLPEIRNGLFDRALYQILRAGIETTNMTLATDALGKILSWYPDSFFGDRSLLMVGQAWNRLGKPSEARLVFVNFLKRFPNSSLAPEVHLAIARTYVQERDWPAAMGKFDDWVQRYSGNPALPRAEYDRAWVYYQAGQQLGNPEYQSNAVALFTNIVAKFPTNEVAVRAQSWVADHYSNIGDHQNAEKNYQLLYQNTNWPASYLSLKHAARINAGRSALARQDYKEARRYFTELINDEQAPPEYVATAYFALGDAIIDEPFADKAKALDKFASAINAFDRIVQKFPNDPLVPRALGRIGDCHFQLGISDPKRYEQAADAYRKAMEHPQADVSTRSQAEIGVALVLQRQAAAKANGEKVALLDQAVQHCLNVLYGKNLRDGEIADPYWLKAAGLLAAEILEGQGKNDEAEKVYRRLMNEVPVLRAGMEKNLERLRQRNGISAPN